MKTIVIPPQAGARESFKHADGKQCDCICKPCTEGNHNDCYGDGGDPRYHQCHCTATENCWGTVKGSTPKDGGHCIALTRTADGRIEMQGGDGLVTLSLPQSTGLAHALQELATSTQFNQAFLDREGGVEFRRPWSGPQ